MTTHTRLLTCSTSLVSIPFEATTCIALEGSVCLHILENASNLGGDEARGQKLSAKNSRSEPIRLAIRCYFRIYTGRFRSASDSARVVEK